MKKRNSWLLMFIVVLMMAALACGGGGNNNSDNSGNSGDSGSGSTVERRGFPLVSDAYEIVDTEFSGTVSIVYKSKMSFGDIVSFYKDELPDMGYDLDQDVTAAGNAVLTFTGDSMLTVTVSADPLDSSAQVVSVSSLPQ